MAGDTIAFGLFTAANAPKTDATPTFTAYRNRSGTARSQPTITHVGGGVYRFQPTTADVLEGIVWAIDAGAGARPARLSGAVCADATPFVTVLLTDSAGALWAGAAPTVGIYRDPSGVARTAPSLIAAVTGSTYLYSLTPSAADLAVGVEFRIDGPSGASPSYASGSFAVAATSDPATSTQGEPGGLFAQTISYAAISSRDKEGRPTLAAPSTSRARVQSVNTFVQDFAGESTRANFKIYLPAQLAVTYQHRIWLTSEGDSTGVQAQARRILKIDKLLDGVGAERFRVVWV
jgi:hypothetical protein